MSTEHESVLISALNEYVFCPRRCGLKYIDGYWADNEHTAVGTLLHDHADLPGYETDAGVTLLRGLPLFSERYGLSGKADIVEVRKGNFGLRMADREMNEANAVLGSGKSAIRKSKSAKASAAASDKSANRNPKSEILYAPVEYKKGKRRKWDNDDVQLCAQALCLEEMFSTTVPEGFIYHAASKRRRKVSFDAALRSETERIIETVRSLIANREVPPAVLKPRCDGCSLRSICLPELTQIAARGKVETYEKNLWL